MGLEQLSKGLSKALKRSKPVHATMPRRRRAALCVLATARALTLPKLRRRQQAPTPEELETWLDTAASVRVRAPPQTCYDAYSDLTRMPEWCPLLSRVTFDEVTRQSEWRMGFKGVSVGWTAQNLEERAPEVLKWTSQAGTENFGAATFASVDGGKACDVEVKITYRTPRVVVGLVEGRRAQAIIRSLLRATLVRFQKSLEGMFPEDAPIEARRFEA